MEKIERKYNAIRNNFPAENGEVKGRLLSEAEVDSVVTLLKKNEAIFEVVGIDMAAHSPSGIEGHKKGQENGITVNLTTDFHPNANEAIWRLRRRLERMPHQLYIQSVTTFELIPMAIEHATIYFSQRRPETLGLFQWVIDGKDKNRVTDWENWWSSTVMPITQSRSLRQPMNHFVDGDYTYFQRFEMTVPEYLWPHINNPRERIGLDIKKILTESFRFSSDSEPGLEMVDILTNATRRALMGNLGIQGWANIRQLMIHRKKHYIRLISLENAPKGHRYPYMQVLRHFSRGGKNMLAPRFLS